MSDPEWPGGLERGLLLGLAAFTLWTALSVLWASGAAAPVAEAQRSTLYVAAVAAALLLLSSGAAPGALLAGIVAGSVAVSLYALGTRLFPGRIGGAYDPSSGYQLAEPIDYWNGLGLLAGMGIALAFGLAAHASGPGRRALAAVALVVLAPTLYFTFSRGALVALTVGLALQFAVDPRRGRLAWSSLVLGAPAALGVLFASRSHSLTAAGATLETAQREGQRVATTLLALGLLAAAAALLLHLAEQRLRPPPAAARVLAISLAACAMGAAVVGIVAGGGPVALVERGVDAFTEPLPAGSGDLDRRLLSVSGNGRGDYWRVAWNMSRDRPVLGAGAGSFEAHWLRDRPTSFYARDAHNLYLETLAELGPFGLALLTITLALPLVALARSRQRPLAPAAGGAYVAFLVHAAVDWDWELPVVTVAALLCGASLLAWTRASSPSVTLTGGRRRLALAALLPLTAIALVTHIGNRAIARSEEATAGARPAMGVAEARRAQAWAPWSHEPWQLLGEAQLALRRDTAARASLRRALELDRSNWSIWYDLALVSRGDERAHALAEATRLNPLSPEADEIRTER